jgi:hypothetical protein
MLTMEGKDPQQMIGLFAFFELRGERRSLQLRLPNQPETHCQKICKASKRFFKSVVTEHN